MLNTSIVSYRIYVASKQTGHILQLQWTAEGLCLKQKTTQHNQKFVDKSLTARITRLLSQIHYTTTRQLVDSMSSKQHLWRTADCYRQL